MNKYEFLTKQLTLQAWEKQIQLARIEAALALKKLEVIETKLKELHKDTEK